MSVLGAGGGGGAAAPVDSSKAGGAAYSSSTAPAPHSPQRMLAANMIPPNVRAIHYGVSGLAAATEIEVVNHEAWPESPHHHEEEHAHKEDPPRRY